MFFICSVLSWLLSSLRIVCRKSDLTDLNIAKRALDPTLFPGVPDGVEVHSGFADAHEKTASQILTEVKRLMATHRTPNVTLVSFVIGRSIEPSLSMTLKYRLGIPWAARWLSSIAFS